MGKSLKKYKKRIGFRKTIKGGDDDATPVNTTLIQQIHKAQPSLKSNQSEC